MVMMLKLKFTTVITKERIFTLYEEMFYFFLSLLFNLLNVGFTSYNLNAPGSYACRGSNRLWTRTLDIHTRA